MTDFGLWRDIIIAVADLIAITYIVYNMRGETK